MDPLTLPGESDGSTANSMTFQAVTATASEYTMDGLTTSTTETHSPPIDDNLQRQYDAYHRIYTGSITMTPAHMRQAQDLALVLLQRHFFPSQGYLVEPAPLGPYSCKGINFMLNDDPQPADPDAPSPNKKKRTTKAVSTHHSYAASWHVIDPSHISTLLVKRHTDSPTSPYRTHTCLTILLDNLATFPHWCSTNLNHRGDVLTDMLGVLGGVVRGQGLLLFGPRLELYAYDAGSVEKPVTPLAGLGRDWRLDMREVGVGVVDEAMREFAGLEVVYRE